MKLKNVFFFVFLLASALMQAQITIGSGKPAEEGALLMLDEGTIGNNGANAKKGLGLPRVELQDYNSLKMGKDASIPELDDKKMEHIGLIVYNINDNFNENDNTSIPSGVHVWDGVRWIGIGTPRHR